MKSASMECLDAWIIDSWEYFKIRIGAQTVTVGVHMDTVTSPIERKLEASTMALRAVKKLWP